MQDAEAYSTDRFNKVPVLGGTTSDELTFVIGMQQYYYGPPPGSPITYASYPPQHVLTAEEVMERLKLLYGLAAPAVLAHYPLARFTTPFDANNRVLADPVQCAANIAPLKILAGQVPAYGYQFS